MPRRPLAPGPEKRYQCRRQIPAFPNIVPFGFQVVRVVRIGVKLFIFSKKELPNSRSKSRTKLKPLFIRIGASAS